MATQGIISVNGKKYMSTKEAAKLWGLAQNTVAKYCKEDKIKDKFKANKNCWYISIDEIKPLDSKEISQILRLTLQLKNKPSLEIDWSCFTFDESKVEPIYRNLAEWKYIEDFSVADKKRIPYEVVLTQKGFELAFSHAKEIDFTSTFQQWTAIVINLAQLLEHIGEIAKRVKG